MSKQDPSNSKRKRVTAGDLKRMMRMTPEEREQWLQSLPEDEREEVREAVSGIGKALEIFQQTEISTVLKKENDASEAIQEHFEAMLADPRLQATPRNHAAIQTIYERIMNSYIGMMDKALDDVEAVVKNLGKAGGKKRHAKTNSARDRLMEMWFSGRYKTKNQCAREGVRLLKISPATARRWLLPSKIEEWKKNGRV
ncbi:hypothetical protein [Thiobacter aerophilum]|uniref:Helix-turn-helix domain-containing protein n=1 Tax=Thiobacter aerophilum TaxID=3121275 RepID=A0ABV0EGM0_9BURK